MQLGTYVDGRPLTYVETTGTFLVGEAPVTAEQVRAYEAAGQLTWTQSAIAEWFHSSFPVTAPAEKPKSGAVIAIVVVAVLFVLLFICGILVAIAIPVFSAAKMSAQTKQCYANERTIEGAALVAESETGELPKSVGGLVPEYLKQVPVCPIAGPYDYDVTTGVADCAEHGHF